MCSPRKPLNHRMNGIDQPSHNHLLTDEPAEGLRCEVCVCVWGGLKLTSAIGKKEVWCESTGDV